MRWAAIVWLATLGAAAVLVGGHDTTVGREITVRISGSAVLGAGVVLLAGALGLHHRRPQGEALASLAALLGTALGLFLFLTQAVNDDPDRRLIVWGAIIALSLGAWWIIRVRMTPKERGLGLFSRLPILKSALSVGLLFSVAQFFYSSIYLPTTAPMSLTLDPAIERPERHGDRFVVRGTVTAENTSSTRVLLLGSSLAVSGYRMHGKDLPPEKFDEVVRDVNAAERDEASVARIQWPPTTVSRSRFVPDEFFFEPGEKFERHFIAWFPVGEFDVARVDYQLVVARPTVGEVEDLEEIETTRDDKEQTTVITRPVPQDGWLQDLTRGDRFTIATYYDDPWYNDATREFAPVFVAFGRTRTPDDSEELADFSDRMQRFYGVGVLDGTAAVPFPAPAS